MLDDKIYKYPFALFTLGCIGCTLTMLIKFAIEIRQN